MTRRFNPLRSHRRDRTGRGFTLIEILVVIGIIVLLLTMAMPAFNFMTGARSEETANNLLGSMLTHARADAIGLQRIRGIAVYRESDTGLIVATYVGVPDNLDFDASSKYWPEQVCRYRGLYWRWTDATTTPSPVPAPGASPKWMACAMPLNVIDGLERSAFPKGVGFYAINSTGGNAADYVRPGLPFVDPSNGVWPAAGASEPPQYVRQGVFLFDASGSLLVTRYHISGNDDLSTHSQDLQKVANKYSTWLNNANFRFPLSNIAFVAFDDDQYSTATSANLTAPTNNPGAIWLSNNTSPNLISRYNGTIMKGE